MPHRQGAQHPSPAASFPEPNVPPPPPLWSGPMVEGAALHARPHARSEQKILIPMFATG